MPRHLDRTQVGRLAADADSPLLRARLRVASVVPGSAEAEAQRAARFGGFASDEERARAAAADEEEERERERAAKPPRKPKTAAASFVKRAQDAGHQHAGHQHAHHGDVHGGRNGRRI